MKMWRAEPCKTFGWIIPQYCRHFLLIMPMIFPVGSLSSLLPPSSNISVSLSSSKASSSAGSSTLSSRTISLGADHFSSGSSSIATMSPSTDLLSASLPCTRIYNIEKCILVALVLFYLKSYSSFKTLHVNTSFQKVFTRCSERALI